MATNIKLSNPVNGYSIFKTNQLLTAEHLNSIGRFFDYHDRLTRARLLGVGIVCGLNINFDGRLLTVSKGVGVTSDGDLMTLETDSTFTGLAPFDDKDAQYDLFKQLTNGNGTSGLLQLTSNTEEDGFVPLATFFQRNNIPANFVVVLYNSQFIQDTDNCTGEDCDGKADMYTNVTRALLINKNDYDKILKEDLCCTDNYFDLPEVAVPRVLLNEKDSIFSYGDLLSAYGNAVNNTGKILDAPLKSATEMAQQIQKCYFLNGGQKQFFTERETGALARLQELIKTFLAERRQGIQYLYDMLKEVCTAYHEFKERVFDLCSGCCVAPDAFPKHLALGLVQDAEAAQSHKYRNCFMESPILNNKDEDIEDALRLFARLARLILLFSIPERASIKITPTVGFDQILEKRSIPYYYDAPTLLADWSPSAFRRNKTTSILSYHASGYSSLPHITDPLSYDIDGYPFFRIEGHIGKTYDAAFIAIDNLRKQFDLPFDIAGVQLQKDRIRFIPPKFVRPGYLDFLYSKEKLLLSTKLDFVKKYNDTLAVNLPNDDELNQPAITKEYGDPKALKNMVLTKKVELETHILSAKALLDKPISEIAGKVVWDDMHLSLANAGAQINKNAKLFTSAAYRSPLETLAVLEQPKSLQWLGDLLAQQKQQVEDGYIFSNFLKENPSMLHNAGVCKGGTFILVYDKTGDVETVVADFYLPYIAKAELVEAKVDPSKITVRPMKDIDFTIAKDIVKRPILNADIFKVNDDLIKVKDLTNKSDLTLNQKINEFEGRINKVGEKVNLNEQSIIQQVGAVKDRYESSFSRLISSYDTVVTKSNIKGAADVKAGDLTREDFDSLITGVRTELNGKFNTLETNFNGKFSDLTKDIASNRVLVQKANTDIATLDGKITTTRNDLTTKNNQDIKTVNDRVSAISNSLEGKITQNGASLDTKLNVAIAGMEQKLNSNAQLVDQKIAATRTEILNIADKAATEKINLQKQAFETSLTKMNNEITRIKPR